MNNNKIKQKTKKTNKILNLLIIGMFIFWITNLIMFSQIHNILFAFKSNELDSLVKLCYQNRILQIQPDYETFTRTQSKFKIVYNSWFIESDIQLDKEVCDEVTEIMNDFKKYKVYALSWEQEEKGLAMQIRNSYDFSNIFYFDKVYEKGENIDWPFQHGDPNHMLKIKKIIKINDHWWRVNFK